VIWDTGANYFLLAEIIPFEIKTKHIICTHGQTIILHFPWPAKNISAQKLSIGNKCDSKRYLSNKLCCTRCTWVLKREDASAKRSSCLSIHALRFATLIYINVDSHWRAFSSFSSWSKVTSVFVWCLLWWLLVCWWARSLRTIGSTRWQPRPQERCRSATRTKHLPYQQSTA